MRMDEKDLLLEAIRKRLIAVAEEPTIEMQRFEMYLARARKKGLIAAVRGQICRRKRWCAAPAGPFLIAFFSVKTIGPQAKVEYGALDFIRVWQP